MPAHATESSAGPPLDVAAHARSICAGVDWQAPLPPAARDAGWRLQRLVKRALDIVASAAGLVLLAPVFVVVGIIVKATSRGPVFYEWRVLGLRGTPFVGYKFRTMGVDADELKARYLDRNEMSGPVFKIRDDPRVTPFGRWLRKYSVDELPQLWSVIRGDMSLVGPRPVYAEEFVNYEPWQRGKLAVTPGITCLWQVSGRSDIREFSTWAAMDLEYIQNWSLWLDLRILLRTLPAVFGGRGAY
ncbi:MAG: sugar transferase [Gemmatimonadota bacterium]